MKEPTAVTRRLRRKRSIMGKVTIIVESDNVPTSKLCDTIQKRITREEFLVAVIRAKYDIPKPDIRMYIVPSDED